MANQLTAPRMGEGIEELTLVKWLKKEGETVQELESIVELETDKVATEIPSPASGVILKLLAEEGAQVHVDDVLAWIGEAGEEIPALKDSAASLLDKIRPAVKTEAAPDRKTSPVDKFLSPIVRKMAQENNVDLTLIQGSGKDGRITKSDLVSFLDTQSLRSSAPAPTYAYAAVTEVRTDTHVQPISGMRRTIADRMVDSVRTAPQVLTVMEADLSRVLAHRELNKPLFEQDGVRLTLTAYFMAATAAGLKSNPFVNASWSDDGLILHPETNIGMAVALGADGLIVPVIKNADTLSLLGIALKVNDLALRARSKKLLPDEVKHATFSLTNHGMSGSLFATPIITLPQVGVLGTGAMQKRAVVVSDEQGNESIAIRPMIYLSFIFDHRVLDGEAADKFLGKVKETLETWR